MNGATITRRSHVLLACWDGEAPHAGDLTVDTVSRFFGIRVTACTADNIQPESESDHGDWLGRVVFWIPVLRGDTARPDHGRHPCYLHAVGDGILDAHATMPGGLRLRLTDLNEYNRELSRLAHDRRQVWSESLMRALPAEVAIPDRALLEAIDQEYVKADSLATRMQWQSNRLFNLFGIMTFTMGLAYLVYDQIFESRGLLIAYMLVLFASLLAYYLVKDKGWFGKHLCYRALAETLRVRFYLATAGLDHQVLSRNLMVVSGLHRFRGFSWIGFVLDLIGSEAGEAPRDQGPTPREHDARLEHFIEKVWIEAQYHYFVHKVNQMEKDSRRVGRLKNVMFVAAVIDISAMCVFGQALSHVDRFTGLPIKNLLTFLSGFIAVVLGVWELRQNKMAIRELLWQYRNQLGQFARARVQLQRTAAGPARDEVLVELANHSLMETYLWVIHRYHREHAPPSAK